jgi:hypothetical protein
MVRGAAVGVQAPTRDDVAAENPGARDQAIKTKSGRVRRAWHWLRTPPRPLWKRLVYAAGAYAVSLSFGFAYLLTRHANGASAGTAAGVGIVVAGPIAIALVWGELSHLRVGPVEIALAEVTVTPLSASLADALQLVSTDSSGTLVAQVAELASTDAELLEVQLHSEPYWWPSRLFLLAAMLDDFTPVRRMVFVAGDYRRDYVGMAEPHVVRTCIARKQDTYEEIYAKASRGVTPDNPQGLSVISWNWSSAYVDVVKVAEVAPDPNALISVATLREVLGGRVEEASLPAADSPASSLTYWRLLDAGQPFVALTNGGQLDKVVSARRLATDIACQALRRELER